MVARGGYRLVVFFKGAPKGTKVPDWIARFSDLHRGRYSLLFNSMEMLRVL